ncbi:MerR family transcriptional regulator [Streptomyces diastatochromogenes]|uniref:Transcriptional regulator n=1 Tax=Streptomyces diastatochromogenes TaxID=42236 RepID=A0A233S0R7_STRDA|nr:MerR family transcriptional regulator [Streptomyces diastatochromogenes]OXY89255.1 transcriptional regulator [Streptomyces diastatochromogenes]
MDGKRVGAGPSAPHRGAAEAGLTTGALARRLGVSPTTLRSWERRYGIGPAERVAGRHRRWSPRDVAVLETMCRLTSAGLAPAEAARAARNEASAGAPQPRAAQDEAITGGPAPAHSTTAAAPPSGDVRQECRGLARAAVRLDAPTVEERLAAAVAGFGLTRAWQEVMVPTLHAVGRKWATSGDRYVEVEHLLSWHVSTTLRRHTRPPVTSAGPTAAGPVLLACVPGEQHTLPLEALNAGLSQLGIATRMFGAAVPAEALAAAVRRLGPAAVVLWAQARSTASLPLAQHIVVTEWGVRGARSRPLVLLGGPGWAGRPSRGMLNPTSLPQALDALAVACRQPGRER